MKHATVCLLALLCTAPALAGKPEAEAALAAATAEEAQAKTAQAAWTPTEQALQAARKALAAGDWAAAQTEAEEALALARRSLEQAAEQKTLWRDAVLH